MSFPRMSLHIGDYLKNTAHLDAALHGAYLLLIMHYWVHEEPPPDDDRQLCAIARMTPTAWKRARSVLQPFFYDGWRHERVEEEIGAARAKYNKHAVAGKKGGRPRKLYESQAFENGKPSESPSKDIGKQPITDNQERGVRETRAREPMISLEAFELAAKYLALIGVDAEDVTWSGWPYSVQTWLTQGHSPTRILSIGAKLCGRSPRMSYHATAVTSELTRPANAGQSNAKTAGNPGQPWQQSRDDWRDALGELSASNERDSVAEGSESSNGTVISLTPSARRS